MNTRGELQRNNWQMTVDSELNIQFQKPDRKESNSSLDSPQKQKSFSF